MAISLRRIVADYRETKLERELLTEFGSVVLYRPPSFLITWVLARFGVSPIHVTLTSGFLLPAMAWSAWFAEPTDAILVVSALSIMFSIFDCVDGNLARSLGAISTRGRYVDFALDVIHRVVFYTALGHLADRAGIPTPSVAGQGLDWILIAAVAGWLVVFTRLCRVYADGLRGPATDEDDSEKAAGGVRWGTWAFAVLSAIDQLYSVLGLVFWLLGLLDLYLLALLALALGDAILAQAQILARLHHGGAR